MSENTKPATPPDEDTLEAFFKGTARPGRATGSPGPLVEGADAGDDKKKSKGSAEAPR